MKTQRTISFKIPKPRTRAHAVLFDNELPFQPKVAKNKMAYTRRPKYVKSQFNDLGD